MTKHKQLRDGGDRGGGVAQRDQTFLSDPFFPPYKQNLTSQKITNRLLLPPIGGGDLSERQRNFHILPLVFGLGLGGVSPSQKEGRGRESSEDSQYSYL